jgi:MSHA biogenesis protein MshP
MKRTSTTCRSRRGFALVALIALLAILAVFGASIVVTSTSQQVGAALDLQGVRAYHAARGGLEWGAYHVLRPGFGGCAGISGKTVAYAGNLTGFSVTLTCTSSVHNEAGSNQSTFEITATACNEPACPTGAAPPPLAYVERQLRMSLSNN